MTCYYPFTSILLYLPAVVGFVLCSWKISGICIFYPRGSVIRMFIGFLHGGFSCTRRCGSCVALMEIENVRLVIINFEIAPTMAMFTPTSSFAAALRCCARTHTQLPPLYTTLIYSTDAVSSWRYNTDSKFKITRDFGMLRGCLSGGSRCSRANLNTPCILSFNRSRYPYHYSS